MNARVFFVTDRSQFTRTSIRYIDDLIKYLNKC